MIATDPQLASDVRGFRSKGLSREQIVSNLEAADYDQLEIDQALAMVSLNDRKKPSPRLPTQQWQPIWL